MSICSSKHGRVFGRGSREMTDVVVRPAHRSGRREQLCGDRSRCVCCVVVLLLASLVGVRGRPSSSNWAVSCVLLLVPRVKASSGTAFSDLKNSWERLSGTCKRLGDPPPPTAPTNVRAFGERDAALVLFDTPRDADGWLWRVTAVGNASLTTTTTCRVARIQSAGMGVATNKSSLKCGAAACRYFWYDIGGGNEVSRLTSHAKYPNSPDRTDKLTSGSFEVPTQNKDNMGSMIEGYVQAPQSGQYRFFTDSDDHSEVWVADRPNMEDGLKKVVELKGCCREVAGSTKLQWTAGQKYYVRALVKEGGGGEYLKVGLQRDGGSKLMPIPISMFATGWSRRAQESLCPFR